MLVSAQYEIDFKKFCLIHLINIMVFLFQEKLKNKPSGCPLGKYGAVQRDRSGVGYGTMSKIILTFPQPNCSLTNTQTEIQ